MCGKSTSLPFFLDEVEKYKKLNLIPNKIIIKSYFLKNSDSEGIAEEGSSEGLYKVLAIVSTGFAKKRKFFCPYFSFSLLFFKGLVADAYYLFIMNIVVIVLNSLYSNNHQTLFDSLIAGSVLLGAIVGLCILLYFHFLAHYNTISKTKGQLFFGFLGDKLGKKKMFIWTLIFMSIFSLASCFAFEVNNNSDYVFIWIIVTRFFLG